MVLKILTFEINHFETPLKSGLGFCKLFWLANFGILISEQILVYHLN
jgi:hypothetical protein